MSWDCSRKDCLLAHRLKPALNNHRWASWCRWPSFSLHATIIAAAARIYLIDVINSLRLRAKLRMTAWKINASTARRCEIRKWKRWRNRAAWMRKLNRERQSDRERSLDAPHPHCPSVSLKRADPCFHNCRSVFKATVLRSVNRLRHHVSARRRRASWSIYAPDFDACASFNLQLPGSRLVSRLHLL